MPSQAAQFDLTTSFLDQPEVLAYGIVRGAGNKGLQQELTDKSIVAMFVHGTGEWDSILRLWIRRKRITLPSSNVHFHSGADGEIGFGMSAVSTGGDQHVDSFFSLLPGGLDPITLSRKCYTVIKALPDPQAPSADLEFIADFQAMKVRQFDSSGNQTSYAWTQNWAWIIADFLIRKFILREGKTNQPLAAAELARFDWPAFATAASYYDAVLAGGQKRFSDGGVVFLGNDNADRALEQLLLMCRSYLLEPNGKFSLRVDKPRSWVFIFNSDNVAPNSVVIRKTNIQGAANRLSPTYRDLNIGSGSSDDFTRFAVASDPQVNHESHQRTTGVRGPGLALMPNVRDVELDFGVNTPERVWRLEAAQLLRQLGDDVDANGAYNAPFTAELVGYEDSLRVENGDVVLLDRSLGEEIGSAPKRSDATRVQTSGGSTLDKFLCTALTPSVNGQAYEMQLTVTNNGAVALRIYNNITGQVVYPGETRNIFLACMGNGAGNLQFDFQTLATGDSIDCVARDPLLRRAGVDENLLDAVGAALDFSAGWTASSGVTATITQGAQLGFEPFRCEVLEIDENPDASDGTRKFTALEYVPTAFPDLAPSQQSLLTPIPGTGIQVPSGGGNHSYRPVGNPLTATDTGSVPRVSVAGFPMRIAGFPDVSENSGTVDATSGDYDRTAFIYGDDPGLSGIVTYNLAFDRETAMNGYSRFFVGSINLPRSGGPDTVGNNDGGAGAQYTKALTLRPTVATAASWNNTPRGIDDDDATFSDGSTSTGTLTYEASGFDRFQSWFTSIVLNIKHIILSLVSAGTATVEYSTDDGASWTVARSVSSADSSPVTTQVTLPASVQTNKVRGRVVLPGSGVTSASANAGTAASVNTGGLTLAWSTPTNAQGSPNGVFTTASESTTDTEAFSHYLELTNFGFAIPGGASILGVQATFRKRKSGGTDSFVFDSSVRLIKGGTLTGTDKVGGSWPAVSSDVAYGGATDLWGTTLTPADVNASNFGVGIAADIYKATGSNSTAFVDAVTMVITYASGGSGTSSGRVYTISQTVNF